MTMEALPQDLADFLVTKNFDPEYFDDKGQPTEAGDAKTMKFDYVSGTGKNYGTAVAVIADNELSLFYGDNLGRGMESEDKQDWFSFLEQLSNTAASHSATWSPRDINQLKHTLAGIAAIKEGLFEGYYGTKKISYMGEQTQARLVIKHNRVLGEDDKRYRYVESLFIETAEQERFRLPFKSLSAGRAMLEHVRSGGNPYDVRGNHITEIVGEMAVLSRFNRAQHHRVFEGVTQELVESARQYYHNLQETVRHLGSPRGYQAYFESWAPDQTGEAEALVENLRDMFVEQTLDARIEAALPTLAKIQQQGNNMKEAQIFENWINNLSEGTWALPETPEQQEKLNQLMSAELIVGPDAINATELLYDIVGDDELFDILNDLADMSEGRANCWDDSEVQRRLAELGIQTPQSTEAEPADVDQDTAPEVKEAFPSKRGGQGRLRDALEDDPDMMGYHAIAALYGPQMWDNDAMGDLVYDLEQAAPTPEELKYIIVNAELPGRLKSIRFTNTDDVQFGHMDEGQINELSVAEGWAKNALAGAALAGAGALGSAAIQNHNLSTHSHDAKKPAAVKVAPTADRTQKDISNYKLPSQDEIDKRLTGGYKLPSQDEIAKRLTGGYKFNPAKAELPPRNMRYNEAKQGMAEGDNMSTFEQDAELSEMLKYAGVPVKESVLNDSTGSTLEHIKDTYKRDIKDFTTTGEMSKHLYHALHDYYHDDMPYGAKTGDSIDPHEWISNRFADDLGINENLISPMIMPVSEGSCNMTAEGEYCPEHGLAECGGMYEADIGPAATAALQQGQSPTAVHYADISDKNAVSNANTAADVGKIMTAKIGENQQDDPINYNAAMTGSYYEGKETDIQEGDALLARIKSLALLR